MFRKEAINKKEKSSKIFLFWSVLFAVVLGILIGINWNQGLCATGGLLDPDATVKDSLATTDNGFVLQWYKPASGTGMKDATQNEPDYRTTCKYYKVDPSLEDPLAFDPTSSDPERGGTPIKGFNESPVEMDIDNLGFNGSSTSTQTDNVYQFPIFDAMKYCQTYIPDLNHPDDRNSFYAATFRVTGNDGITYTKKFTKLLVKRNNDSTCKIMYLDQFSLGNSAGWKPLQNSYNSDVEIPYASLNSMSINFLFMDIAKMRESWESDCMVVLHTGSTKEEYTDLPISYMVTDSDGVSKRVDMPPFAGDLHVSNGSTSTEGSFDVPVKGLQLAGRYAISSYTNPTTHTSDLRQCLYDDKEISGHSGTGKNMTLIYTDTSRTTKTITNITAFSKVEVGSDSCKITYTAGGTTTTATNIDINEDEEIDAKIIINYTFDNVVNGMDTKDKIDINLFDYDKWGHNGSWYQSGHSQPVGNGGVDNQSSIIFHSETGLNRPGNTLNKYAQNGARNLYSTKLDKNYYPNSPQLSSSGSPDNQHSTAFLFNDKNNYYPYKYNWTNMTGLFDQDYYNETGFYAFSSRTISANQYGSIDGHPILPKGKSGNFAQVSKRFDSRINKTTANSGEYSEDELNDWFTLRTNTAVSPNGDPLDDQNDKARMFVPFTDYGASEGYTDFYFGMTVSAKFRQAPTGYVQAPNGGEWPMRYVFNGDDDVLIYIDGVLFLDIGGVHNAKGGYIDFATGKVLVKNNITGGTDYETDFTNLLKAAGKSDYEISQILEKKEYTDQNGVKKEVTTFKNDSEHTLEMFYLERGAGASNCEVFFNMPLLPKKDVAISKTLDDKNSDNETVNVVKNKEEFYYKVLVDEYLENDDPHYSGSYKPIPDQEYYVYNKESNEAIKRTSSNGFIHIKAGEKANISGYKEKDRFQIVECDEPNSTDQKAHWISGKELWSDTKVAIDPAHGGLYDSSSLIVDGYVSPGSGIESSSLNESENTVAFKNTPDTKDLRIKKRISNQQNSDIFVAFNGEKDATGMFINPSNSAYSGPYEVYDASNDKLITSGTTSDGKITNIYDNTYVLIPNVQVTSDVYVSDVTENIVSQFGAFEYVSGNPVDGQTVNPVPNPTKVISGDSYKFITSDKMVATIPTGSTSSYSEIDFAENLNLDIKKSVELKSSATDPELTYTISAGLYNSLDQSVEISGTANSFAAKKYNDDSTVTDKIVKIQNGEIVYDDGTYPELKKDEKLVILSLLPNNYSTLDIKTIQPFEKEVTTGDKWEPIVKFNNNTYDLDTTTIKGSNNFVTTKNTLSIDNNANNEIEVVNVYDFIIPSAFNINNMITYLIIALLIAIIVVGIYSYQKMKKRQQNIADVTRNTSNVKDLVVETLRF